MGRRSYEEIGRPLPDRTTIVISSTKNYNTENCVTAGSLKEALELSGNKDIYISGGAMLYEEAIPLVGKMYITEIDLKIKGDTFFPQFNEHDFEKELVKTIDGDIPYAYVTYTRKKLLNYTKK